MTAADDTCCGIYCGACSVRRYGETGSADAFVSCLAGVRRAEIACAGCKSAAVYAGCRSCQLRDCAEEKGLSHCSDCGEYPCQQYKMWQRVGALLPHVRSASASLEVIRRDGADAWKAAQRARWACQSCGETLSWYARTCSACGQAAGSATHSMSGIRKLLCRLVLPMAYRKGKRRAASGPGSS